MSGFLTAVLAVGVILGFMILIHEFGHFAVAKLGDAPFPGEDRPCAFLLPLG